MPRSISRNWRPAWIFRTFGASLGATFDRFSADIPLSLQTLDLGWIPAGGSVALHYVLVISATTKASTEIAAWQFSDPFQVDGTGEFPTVVFSDVAAVPEPSGLMAFVAGLALLGAERRGGRSYFAVMT
jgi:hypothetical protein